MDRCATKVRAGFYAAAGLISLGIVIATASRFASLCTLAALATVAGLAWREQAQLPRGLILLLAAIGVALLLITLLYGGELFLRAGELGGDFSVRTRMWSHYLDLAEGAPIGGYGLGSFPSLNTYSLSGVRFAELTWSANSAHDIFLQLAINGGIPYLVLIVAAAVMLVRQVLRGLHLRWDLPEVGVAAALLLILSSALIDIALDVPGMVSVALFLAGLLWGTALVPGPLRLQARRGPPRDQEAGISG
jgi:O-antigen ligase